MALGGACTGCRDAARAYRPHPISGAPERPSTDPRQAQVQKPIQNHPRALHGFLNLVILWFVYRMRSALERMETAARSWLATVLDGDVDGVPLDRERLQNAFVFFDWDGNGTIATYFIYRPCSPLYFLSFFLSFVLAF
jgi:hypothetical protein